MREIAIINKSDDDFSEGILKKLSSDLKITVFQDKARNFDCGTNVETVILPKELDNDSKIRNYISKYYIERQYKGFLHVIQDSVEILKDTSKFFEEIENMMCKFGLKSWFNTYTDPCNFTFKKYNPRASVLIDEPKAMEKYNKKILWTSHSNTSWVCYNFEISEFEDMRFDENFSITMFQIIEFLARRRNTKKNGELYYMNYYPTVEEEIGVFRLRYNPPKQKTESETREEQETMAKENKIFGEMNINHGADVPIEPVIEDMYNCLVK